MGLLFLGTLQGQKLVEKAFLGSHVQSIQIDAGPCYRIDLVTGTTDQVEIVAHMEGEYARDLMISMKEEAATLKIGVGFQPGFNSPNDKLSAHKVVSIALAISLPSQKRVQLFGTGCHVRATGDYRHLEISLSDGSCHLEAVGERVEASTQQGDIWLLTASGQVQAHSEYGQVLGEKVPPGAPQFVLHSVEGDIHIRKTK